MWLLVEMHLVTSLAKFKFRRSCDMGAEEFGDKRHLCTKHSINYGLGGWHYKIFHAKYCENVDGRLGFRCTTTIIGYEWQLDANPHYLMMMKIKRKEKTEKHLDTM